MIKKFVSVFFKKPTCVKFIPDISVCDYRFNSPDPYPLTFAHRAQLPPLFQNQLIFQLI